MARRYRVMAFFLRLGALPFALAAALFFGGIAKIATGPDYFQTPEERRAEKVAAVVLGVLCVCSGSVAFGLVYAREKVVQRRADILADDLVSDLESGIPRQFLLYLRPFAVTGRLVTRFDSGMPSSLFLPSAYLQSTHRDLETKIAKAFKRKETLLALGTPGEAVGAARVAADKEEWQALVALLAREAAGVIVVPAGTEGTLWEIAHLKDEKHLPKTAFIMPPKATKFDTAAMWAEAHESLQRIGLELPAYDVRGLLFGYSVDGEIAQCMALREHSPRALRSDLRLLTIEQESVLPNIAMQTDGASRRR